ncbi:hypothetical protein AB3N59_12770 [Leptospira sp. WS92.C1]
MLSILLLSLSFSNCKEQGNRPDFEKENPDPILSFAIQKDRELLRSEIKDSYTIQNSSYNLKEAILKALKEIRDNSSINKEDLLKYSCNQKEIRNIYLPNNIDQNNIIANSKIEDAMYLLLIRRTAGIDKIRQNLRGSQGPIKILSINHPEKPRKINNINGYVIREIQLQVDSKTIIIDEIKLIIEHKNQFKVCTYGT